MNAVDQGRFLNIEFRCVVIGPEQRHRFLIKRLDPENFSSLPSDTLTYRATDIALQTAR